MPAPKKRPAKTAASSEASAIAVVMASRSVKKHSIKFYSEAADLPFDNLYVKASAVERLGDPAKIKVTIEAYTGDE